MGTSCRSDPWIASAVPHSSLTKFSSFQGGHGKVQLFWTVSVIFVRQCLLVSPMQPARQRVGQLLGYLKSYYIKASVMQGKILN